MLKRVRWRWILPLMQVVLAGVLLYWGDVQYRARVGDTSLASGWDQPIFLDYSPPALTVLLCLNLPAVLMISPLLAVPLENTYIRRAIFLAIVFLFWRWVGSGLDLRTGALVRHDGVPSRARLGFWGIGATAALALAGLGIWAFVDPGGMSFLVPAAIIAWSVLFLWHFGRKLWTYRQSRRRESAVR